MSEGELRVGIGFNPSGDGTVAAIKRQSADPIDLIETIDPASDGIAGEVARPKALAQTDIESAAMWAVKAATKRAA